MPDLQAHLVQTVGQFIFGGLFIWLLKYVLQTNKEREKEYMEHIDRYDTNLEKLTGLLEMLKADFCHRIDAVEKDIDSIDGKLEQIINNKESG